MIIFLDFDGVLNHTSMDQEEAKSQGVYFTDPKCIEHLRNLVMKTNAQIVISSTWRILNDRKFFEDYLGEYLGSRLHIDWCTKRLGTIRGLEIREWIERNESWKFKDYIILDDDQDFLWHQPLVHIDHSTGLDERHVQKALMMASNLNKIEVPEVLSRDTLERLSNIFDMCKDNRRGSYQTIAAIHEAMIDIYR